MFLTWMYSILLRLRAFQLTLLYFFLPLVPIGVAGGTQLSVSSKVGGLEKGHPLSSEGVCHGVAPSFSWSSSRSPAGVFGVVWHFNTCLITRNTAVNSISFHFSALVSDVNNFSSFCVRGRKVPFTRSTGHYAH